MKDCIECRRKGLLESVNNIAKETYGDFLKAVSTDVLEMIVREDRCCGKTTAKALEHISSAMHNPGKPVYLVHDTGDSPMLNSGMREVVKELLCRLGFNYFTILHHNNTLTYSIK
jgi:hypothetical protein